MAATVAINRNMGGVGGMACRDVTITGDSSYATGGYAISANSCGLGSITELIPTTTTGGYSPAWDQSNLKLLLFADQTNSLQAITKAVTAATMTDNTDATGYIDFASNALPAGAIVAGWKMVTSTGFTGDTTAVMKVGIAADLDRFSATTTGSVLAAGTITSAPLATGAFKTASAQTPRITITGAADFTSISAGAGTCTLYYSLPSDATTTSAQSELASTTNASAVVVRALVFGTP